MPMRPWSNPDRDPIHENIWEMADKIEEKKKCGKAVRNVSNHVYKQYIVHLSMYDRDWNP